MNKVFEKIILAAKDSSLRARLLFVLVALALFRFCAAIPIPGVDHDRLVQFFTNNQLLGLLNIFSGGGLSNLSIVMLGIGPYITASIIMQLMTMLSPRMKQLYQEEGDAGRQKFGQYSRLLTLPLALIQGAAFLTLLERQGILSSVTPFAFATNLIIVVSGSILLMWLGELVTEYGIGNGVSLIVFAGIVATIPSTLSQYFYAFDQSQIPLFIAYVAVALVIIAGVVMVTEAERPIPVTYAKQVRGARVFGGIATYLPLRLNQAGVIPIIFALSILLFPSMLFNILSYAHNTTINNIGSTLQQLLNPTGVVYGVLYFILVFLFTYFYTAVTFDPQTLATNLQKNGAFIPGVRPGESTVAYVSKIVVRITFVGAIFLGVIAVLPIIMQGITGVTTLVVGGTSLLIVVSVVLDLIRKIDAQVSMRQY